MAAAWKDFFMDSEQEKEGGTALGFRELAIVKDDWLVNVPSDTLIQNLISNRANLKNK